MSNSKLEIQPQPCSEALSQQFDFIGMVDVDAVAILETLYILPPNSTVELNFAQVQRVNSMGLAQLLKLFEHWQQANISIHIINANRMIAVLFKMTGLTKYLSTGKPAVVAVAATASTQTPQAPAVPAAATIVAATPAPIVQAPAQPHQPASSAKEALNKSISPTPLDYAQESVRRAHHERDQHSAVHPEPVEGFNQHLSGKPAAPALSLHPPGQESAFHSRRVSVPRSNVKLNLWVSAQNSQQVNGWYFFNTYLQRHLGREIHLELEYGAMGERRKSIEQMDIVFTKPFESTNLMLKHHFHPLMRPIDQTDEVTLLVRADDQRQQLKEFEGGTIVTAAKENFVYLLGRFLLEEDEAALANMQYQFAGYDIKALQTLLRGNADILFMLSDSYNGLSGLTSKMLRKIDQSETAFAFHLFCVAPQCAELAQAIDEVLLNMSMDSQGRQILGDLGIEGWCKPSQDEIDMLAMLFNRYTE